MLQRTLTAHSVTLQRAAYYQFGEGILQVVADDHALYEQFAQRYSDCAVSAPVAPEVSQVCCIVRHSTHPPLALLTFQAGAPRDPAGTALSLFRGMTPVAPPYVVTDSPLAGWRLAGGATQPVLAACEAHVLVDVRQVAPDFLVEYLVSATLAAQPGVIVVHAASLCIGGAGVVLVAPSHGGKTTTALHLAARGHALLGDEAAVIRLATNELLPFRRAVSPRCGPRTPDLEAVLDQHKGRQIRPVEPGDTVPLQLTALFPQTPAHPARLRAAFFLCGFAARPSLTPCQFTLQDAELCDWLASNDFAYTSWGLAPARRTLRLLALKQILAPLPCWRLHVGAPGETVELIEQTMEGLGC